MAQAQRKARSNVDAAAAGKPKARGYRDDMDVSNRKTAMERGRAPDVGHHGERRR